LSINTIFLVDAEQMFIDCLAVSLEKSSHLEVVGFSYNGITALHEIKDKTPDLVFAELELEGIGGIDLLRKIKATHDKIKFILLISTISPAIIHKALSSGVDGIIMKNDPYSLLLEAISVIHRRNFLSPSIMDPLVNNYLSVNTDGYTQKVSPLSDREEQIAKLISNGQSSKEIAGFLSISIKTVSKHRQNIFKKLNISNTAQLVNYVLKNELIG